jgi:hypothetical protein
MQFLYEVNLQVDKHRADEFHQWLLPHIQEMISFAGFETANWYERKNTDESVEEDVVLWTIQYALQNRAAYETYVNTHASRMRADGMTRFGGSFTASRRLLHLHQVID